MSKLQDWQEKYEKARNKYNDSLSFYEDTEAQYNGTRKHITRAGAEEPRCLYNMSKELIESQIDAVIPTARVESNSMSDKKRARASAIEALIKSELTRLNFAQLNDLDERIVKITSVDFALTEWDSLVKDGVVNIKPIHPTQLIPQPGVYEIDDMDYLFLVFEDTKERIKERYGKDVSDATTDPRSQEETDTDNVTQVIVYYRNKQRKIGCFSWVTGTDTILIDDSNYNARGRQKCSSCGSIKIQGQKKCECGGKWEKNDLEYEELSEDIQTQFGAIPAVDYAKENGELLLEEVEQQITDPYTGEPMYEQMFDEQMNPVGDMPMTEIIEQPYTVATKIPYYVPKEFPVAMRKNISLANSFRGDSDCETIWKLQDSMDKLLTKADIRGINSGTIIAKLKSIRHNVSNKEFDTLEVDTLQDLNGIKPINVVFDTSQVESQAMAKYDMAKSVLGITDTSQGKPDSTATTGVAKEIQVSQAQGRQQSKKVMKEAFYTEMFKRIFWYYLAYSDVPITYTTTDERGQEIEKVFNRYDFLDQDENGNWYYDDDFIFSIDPTGSVFSSKQFQLEDMRQDMGLGMYGDPADPNTKLMYWKNKANLGYPNSKVMVAYWQDIVTKQEQEAMMMQQMQEEMMIQQPTPGMPPMLGGQGGMNKADTGI